jgi:enediyne biosynthesis protein E4
MFLNNGLKLAVSLLAAVSVEVQLKPEPTPAGSAFKRNNNAALVFTDVTREAGLAGFRNVQGGLEKPHILEVMGGGAAFLDYNRDGNLDIVLIRGATIDSYRAGGDPVCVLYRGDGRGRFQNVTQDAELNARGWGMGIAVADYDNDGWDDLFITGYGRNFLFRNRGNGRFEDVSAAAGVSETRWSLGAAFVDIDRDGDLDLYVANYLEYPLDRLPRREASCSYRGFPVFCGPRGLPGLRDALFLNDGKGRFRDVAVERDIDPEKLYGLGVVAADYDNDGWPDIFVANDLVANLLYHNLGGGTFEEVALTAGAALSEDGIEEGSMGVDFGDFNNDGWLDLYYTNSSYQTNTLLVNNRDRSSFTNVSNIGGHGQITFLYVGWGTAFADLDNDGWEDLFVVNGHLYPEADRFAMGLKYKQQRLVFMNQAGSRFVETAARFGLRQADNSRGAAFGDYDSDGDLDVLVNNLDGPPTLLRNDGGSRNHWLRVRCVGSRSNRSAVGTRLTLRAGGRQQTREVKAGASYISHNDLALHFGLGTNDHIDWLEIRWPSGSTDRLENLKVNQVLTVEEGRVAAQAGPGK